MVANMVANMVAESIMANIMAESIMAVAIIGIGTGIGTAGITPIAASIGQAHIMITTTIQVLVIIIQATMMAIMIHTIIAIITVPQEFHSPLDSKSF